MEVIAKWSCAAALVMLLMAAKPISGDAERGAYVARLADCTSCHTKPGKPEFAGGYPLLSPFGIIYSSNITPDKTYGIGNYTLQDFTRALRKGIAEDGHRLYPAMPYPSYAKMTDQDVADLYAYFNTKVAPVPEQPKQTDLPFPFNQRWALAIWDFFFRPDQVFTPDPAHDARWNRGAYLVQSLAHCGACHTPRNLAFEERAYDQSSEKFLSGGVIESQFAPDLRQDAASGLGDWSEQDIADFLKMGHARGVGAFANMKDFVEKSGQYMSDDDLLSIAHYLKSLPPVGKPGTAYAAPADPVAETKEIVSGEKHRPGAGIYLSACASCHGQSGEGKGALIPRVAGNPAILSVNPGSLIFIMLNGAQTPRTKAGVTKSMPSFDGKLTDSQVADVLSFIRTSWGNHAQRVSTRDVDLARQAMKKDPKTKIGKK